METYDCLIIGGGPAGLSAAIYMGRFLRKTLIIDDLEGRSTYAQINENYLGFPDGIAIKELRRLGEAQATRFGVQFLRAQVDQLQRSGDDFIALCTDGRQVHGRTVILCSGVEDIWPQIPNVENYVGKSLFWCITCDGFRTAGKRLVLFGTDEDAATTACQFNIYTDKITFVAPGGVECASPRIQAMEAHGIEIIEGSPQNVEGTPEEPRAVLLEDGRRFECDLMFSLFGCRPNVKLAKDVGAELTSKGFVRIDHDGYTTVPGFFCAGDVSGIHTHQVASAVHEGAEAAQTANYYLYAGYQKLEYATSKENTKPHLELR